MKRFAIACCLLLTLCAQARTWHVAGDVGAASDRSAGSEANPLRTIGEAMRRLSAGDEVVLADGIYRETVVVPKLAPTEKLVTTIRARNPGKAVIRGSDLVGGWHALDAGRYWVDWSGHAEPEQVYVDGAPLQQIGGTVFGGYPGAPGHELAPAHASEGGIWLGRRAGDAGTLKVGEFNHDGAAKRLVIRLAAGVEPGRNVEVSTRPFVLLAENVSWLRLEGIVFEHANTSSIARQGAVKVYGSNNSLAGVVIRKMDAIGLQLFGASSELVDSTIEDCGQLGINARGRNLTIARNRILRNNTRGFNKWWEAGGMKMVGDPGLHDSVIRDNVVAFNRGDGIWIDWMNTNIRITHNVSAFNAGFGIHYEASQKGWIDGNATYGNTQRGIYVLESSDTLVERNIAVANGLEGIVVADGERSTQYPALKPHDNRVFDNVTGWNKDVEMMLPLRGIAVQSDRNVFIAEQPPGMVQGWTALTNRPARGLAAWRERSQLDGASRERVTPRPAALADILRDQRLVTVEQLGAVVSAALP